jgi:hypothetical protein
MKKSKKFTTKNQTQSFKRNNQKTFGNKILEKIEKIKTIV